MRQGTGLEIVQAMSLQSLARVREEAVEGREKEDTSHSIEDSTVHSAEMMVHGVKPGSVQS